MDHKYCITMAKATAGMSLCPNHRIGVVLCGPNDIMPCGCGSAPSCRVGKFWGCDNCTPENALLATLAGTLAGCERSRISGGTAYIAAMSKEGAVQPIMPDNACWQLLDAYHIEEVYVVDPITELAVEVTMETEYPFRATDPDWVRVPNDQVLHNAERLNRGLSFANSNNGMSSTLLRLLWTVGDRLQLKADPSSKFCKKAALRYNGLNLQLRDEEDPSVREEREFLACVLQLRNKSYLVFWDMEQQFPSFFKPGVLKAKLLEYGLSCACAAGENRETCYLIYWAEDGESYLEWLPSMGDSLSWMMAKKEALNKFCSTSLEWSFVTNAIAGWKQGSRVFPVLDGLTEITDEIRELMGRYRMRCERMQDGVCYAEFLDTVLAPNIANNK